MLQKNSIGGHLVGSLVANICLLVWAAITLVLFISASSLYGGEFINGTDISALTVLENSGATYSDAGIPGTAIDILENNGINWHRLRIFVDPASSDPVATQDLDYTIALAQRTKAHGSRLLLDFHYSDTWADPGKQIKPSAWAGLNFPQLEQQVYDYTKNVIEEFKNAGVVPEMIQIGNEISNGMLWSDGQLWLPGVPESQEFNNLASLISAGIHGAKDGAGASDEPLIMVHFANGANWEGSSDYFDRLLPRLQANGTDIDVIGYSYYPKWHYDPLDGDGGMDDVQQNLNNTAAAYGKPVVIVEAGFASRGPQYEPDYEFDVSEQGQQDYLQAIVDALETVPDNMGWGAFWWYAEAVPTTGVPVWEGGRYGLFDENGDALPAQEVFADRASQNASIQGDFDFDDDVDGKDFLILQQQNHFTGMLAADANGDFRVNSEDLQIWKSQFGTTLPMASHATIPEPSGFILLGMAIATWKLCFFSRFNRRPRRLQCPR